MAQFHNPSINPFQVPVEVGTGNVKSNYLYNNYNIEWTPSRWRYTINSAINYSDLTSLDTLYSWCLQASPFLVSQIQKRLIPIYKRNFAFAKNGNVNEKLTQEYIKNSWWFDKLIRYMVLSKFYGVKLLSVDAEKKIITDFPLRNIDIKNKAIRYETYGYYNVVNVDDYDDLLYFEPETDQDFRLGMLQPISRNMITIVETYVNWQTMGAKYSKPLTIIGFDADNDKAKQQAMRVAENIDMMTIPLVPKTTDIANGGKSIYNVEVNSQPIQASNDAFRLFKELINECRSEIMQLVTGGTLLGATEKNTNSEQLAEIHMELYRDILDSDAKMVIEMFNKPAVKGKLSVLFGEPEIANLDLIEIPDMTVSQKLFVSVGDMMSKQGAYYKAEAYEKVGLSREDIVIEKPAEEKQGILSGLLGKKGKKTDKKEE